MGPSGAGKTTLLNILSQRCKTYEGHVMYGEELAVPSEVGAIAGFVQQEDLFIPTLTPLEHLRFHATMRMANNSTKEERDALVTASLSDLGLTKCRDTLIGGQGSMLTGISGGEKKRLSLATEILSNPSLVFADEPTSGLDSYMAESVVAKLKDITDSGRLVLATVHQPNSEIFGYFTHLHLLAGGKTAYAGPVEGALEYFRSLGHPCPSHYNPADHYIKLLSVAVGNKHLKVNYSSIYGSLCLSLSLYGLFLYSLHVLHHISCRSILNQNHDKEAASKEVINTITKHQYNAPWTTQFTELYRRTLLSYKREPILARVRLAQAVVVGVIAGLIYLQLGDTQADVQSKMGAMFFVVLNQCILGTLGVLQVFPLEMPILLRDHESNTYGVGAYFLSRTMAEIPIQLIFPALHATIVYWMVGLPADAATFLLFIMYVTLTANAAVSLGYCIGALAKSVAVALALGPLILMPLVIFGGLLVNVNAIPAYFVWLSVFSFVQYGFGGVSIVVWEKIGELECPPPPQPCQFTNGASVISYLGFDPDAKLLYAVALICLTVGFRLIGYLGLKYRTR
ncbi:unnamed protein product [Chrysoparadoxa australica]